MKKVFFFILILFLFTQLKAETYKIMIKELLANCFYENNKEMTKFVDDILSKEKIGGVSVDSYGGMEKVIDAIRSKYPNYDFNKCQPSEDQVSKKALRWQKKNTWFGVNEEMTNYAVKMHERLVNAGVDTESNKYYKEIDKQMRMKFPNYEWK
jgi:hypothetical protein